MKYANQGSKGKGDYERSWKLLMNSHDDDKTIVITSIKIK